MDIQSMIRQQAVEIQAKACKALLEAISRTEQEILELEEWLSENTAPEDANTAAEKVAKENKLARLKEEIYAMQTEADQELEVIGRLVYDRMRAKEAQNDVSLLENAIKAIRALPEIYKGAGSFITRLERELSDRRWHINHFQNERKKFTQYAEHLK